MFVPLLTLIAAWWSDRQHADASPAAVDQMGGLPAALGGRDLAGDDRISLEMGRRQPLGERFGVLPLLAAGLVAEGAAVAGGAQVIAFPGAAAAGAGVLEVGVPMALLFMGDIARRYYEAASVVQAMDWGRTSPRWREASLEISKLAAKNGYDLDPLCSWIVSPETRAFRHAQITEEVLRGGRTGGGGDAITRIINNAWTKTGLGLKTLARTASDQLGNLLKIPYQGGLVTKLIAGEEASWWAAFVAGLIEGGVSPAEIEKIKSAIDAAEGQCVGALRKIPKNIFKSFAKYLFNMKLLRAKILELTLRAAGPITSTIALGLISKASTQLMTDRHGFWIGVHDVFETLCADLFGTIPQGGAYWKAPGLDTYLVDVESGVEFPEGSLIPLRTFEVKARVGVDRIAKTLMLNGKPVVLRPENGHSYILWTDQNDKVGGNIKVCDRAPDGTTKGCPADGLQALNG